MTMRINRRRPRRGAALLEALVALVVLTTAGAAITALAVMSGDATHRAHSAEEELRRADAFFSMVSLWPREDLDRHLGDHEQGSWRLHVDRSMPTLYTITLRDSLGARTLLRTVLYRPEQPRDTI
jgi:hypothetical protein